MYLRALVFRVFSKFTWFAMYLMRDRLRVLAYHGVVDSTSFRLQIEYLVRNYRVLSLEHIIDCIATGRSLPSYAVLVTFDDGDVSVLENGLPVLKQFGAPAVLFVISGLIDTQNPFWWDRVKAHYRRLGFTSAGARAEVNVLKRVSNVERERQVKLMQEESARQLTLRELQILDNAGIVIANHSHTHPMLDQCTEKELKEELSHSSECFGKWGIGRFDVFAYPNGNANAHTRQQLEQAGVKIAFLFDHKLNQKTIDPLAISRIRVNADDPLAEFKVRVSGLHSLLMRRR